MPRTSKDAAKEAANALIKTVQNAGASMTITTSEGTTAHIPARTAHIDEDTGEILAAETRPIVPDGYSTYLSADPVAAFFIPPDDYFDPDTGFLEANNLASLLLRLREKWPEFAPIGAARIDVYWKRKGGKSAGKSVFGKATKPNTLLKFVTGQDFIIWIAADHCRDAHFSNARMEALLYHELLHCWIEIDEDPDSATYGEFSWSLRGHDVEAFHDEITRYGTWHEELRQLRNTYEQLALKAGS